MAEYLQQANARAAARTSEEIMVEDEEGAGLAHLKNWVTAIKTRKSPYETAEVGHSACSVAHMVNLSIGSGNSVWWDFDRQTVKKM